MNQQDSRNWIGKPLDRVDGPAKVTGQATYAADYRGTRAASIGFIVEAGIGKGRISSIDTTAAEASDGVLLVLSHKNAPEQAPFGSHEDAGRFGQSHAVLENDQVKYHGAPVAFVVAETLEQARHAAHLIEVEYDIEAGVFDAEAHEEDAVRPDSLDGADEADKETGNFEKTFDKAPVTVEAEYHTPAQHASAMEPHATVAEWSEGKLTVHMAIQILSDARKGLAHTLKIEPGDVRIVSPFIGGGFGSKLGIHNEAVLAALAARELDRPVRVAQTRRNLFSNGPHRTEHRQRLKLGADTDGRLLAISHDSLAAMSRGYPFAEAAGGLTQSSYAAQALRMRHRIVEADIPKVDSMRAPGEAIGTLTFESAIDELAERCGVDPVQFRLLNEPETEPGSGKPFSTRPLARCLSEGAASFGWRRGPVRPGGKRDGRWLVGHGVAAAIRPNNIEPAGAEASLSRDGRLTLKLDMTDIGTGTYTILGQIAAEALGMQAGMVEVRLGDSDFAETCGSGGSFGAGSTGTAVHEACQNIRADILSRAARIDAGWSGVNSGELRLDGDRVSVGDRSLPLGDILDAVGGETFHCKAHIKAGDAHETMAQYSYGALFAEVGVDTDTAEIRLRRLLGVFDAGRILNRKTAHSQLMGGMIFGIGAALLEESLMDKRYGAFMNRDLAEYHIAVNRDVPRLEVHMLDGFDRHSNPLGSKGIGELGICGAGPAIANAVYDATGHRARKFPIHIEDVLPAVSRLVG